MKQLIKINNSELSFRLKLNYNNVYSRMKMLLGKNASIFADLSTKSIATTWYSNDDAEYAKLSEASEAEALHITRLLTKKLDQVAKELKNSPELLPYVDDIMEVPDSSFVFYRKNGDEYLFVLTAWGCKYAYTNTNDTVGGVIKRLTKKYEPEETVSEDLKKNVAPQLEDDTDDAYGFSNVDKLSTFGNTHNKKNDRLEEKKVDETKEAKPRPEHVDSEKPKKLQHVVLRVLDQNNHPVPGELVNINTVDGQFYKESNDNGIIEIGNLPCFSLFTISFPNIKSFTERTFQVESMVGMYDAYIKRLVKYSPVLFVEDQNGNTVQNHDIKIMIAGQDTIYNTGETGMIQLPAMMDGQKFIAIDTLNYANTEEFDVTSEKAKKPYYFRINRSEKVNVGIKILDKSGKPIPNTLVNIESGDMPCEAMTGADGRVEFPHEVFGNGIIPLGIKLKNKSKIYHELNFNPDVTEYAIQVKGKNPLSGFNWMWLAVLPLLALLGWGGHALYQKYKTTPVDDMKSGVVMVLTESYYYVDFGLDDITIGGNPCVAYFTFNDDNELVITFDPTQKPPTAAYGTGFLISEDGHIATNKHVADPNLHQESVEQKLREYFQNKKELYQERADEINDSLRLRGSNNRMRAELKRCQQQIRNLDRILNTGIFKVQKETNLYVAFTGTNIDPDFNRLDGFIACNHLISGDAGDQVDANDVAIMQLINKGKEVPEGAFIFKVPEKDILGKKMPENRKVIVIGYNKGTKYQNLEKQDDIQPQQQPGELNNLSEKYRIGYNAAVKGGSSGAPVVNADGVLVAVNNSGKYDSENFNFGIRTKYLREIMDQVINKNDEK